MGESDGLDGRVIRVEDRLRFARQAPCAVSDSRHGHTTTSRPRPTRSISLLTAIQSFASDACIPAMKALPTMLDTRSKRASLK